jgi:rhodanese-related sulfurtransferase
MSIESMSPETVRQLVACGDEVALIDVREEGAFSSGHLLWAVCIPFSRLELRVDSLIPRQDTPVIICDANGELALQSAARLATLGYSNVAILEGGLGAWTAAGYEIFSGVNVPSKAFGEFVEHAYHTPDMDAGELKTRLDAGDDLVVLDSRPLDEFHAMSLPQGQCVPGAELVYRVHDVAPNASTTVVVNCAGRTRSIIGAQSLINAGIENPVIALRNGTMGWHLAGQQLRRGEVGIIPPVTEQGMAHAEACAARVAERFGVSYIEVAELDRMRADQHKYNLFILDVRTAPEYEAGHIQAARHAPGGQLVQATDQYVGVLGARIVLTDDNAVRATMSASWLIQLGWQHVYVLRSDAAERSEAGPERVSISGLEDLEVELLSAPSLARIHAQDRVNLIDLSRSRAFLKGHISGARHAVRSRLAELLAVLPSRSWLVFTSEDGVLARFAAADVESHTEARVAALMGGNQSWRDSKFELVSGSHGMDEDTDDVWVSPYDNPDNLEAAMNAYLSWEVGLVEQIERDGTTRFKRFD